MFHKYSFKKGAAPKGGFGQIKTTGGDPCGSHARLFITFYRLPGNGEKAGIVVILKKRRDLHPEATTMALRLMLVSLLLLATAACSAYHKELDDNPPFTSHHYRYYDLDVVWQSERTDEGIRVTGKVTNRRDYYLRDLELTVRLLDSQGVFLAKNIAADFPTYIPPGETVPFRMELSLSPGTAPEWVRFTYVYWLAEEPPGFRGYDEVPYFGNFNSPL
jgi:hypothetical protein